RTPSPGCRRSTGSWSPRARSTSWSTSRARTTPTCSASWTPRSARCPGCARPRPSCTCTAGTGSPRGAPPDTRRTGTAPEARLGPVEDLVRAGARPALGGEHVVEGRARVRAVVLADDARDRVDDVEEPDAPGEER